MRIMENARQDDWNFFRKPTRRIAVKRTVRGTETGGEKQKFVRDYVERGGGENQPQMVRKQYHNDRYSLGGARGGEERPRVRAQSAHSFISLRRFSTGKRARH